MSSWSQVRDGRWRRSDGAVVKWDADSPYPNPANPRALMWTAWEPDPSERPVRREVGRARRGPDGKTYRLSVPVRFKSAEAAMRRVDTLFPLLRD